MSSPWFGLKKNKRIVIKIGSSVIASYDKGLHEERLEQIAAEVAVLRGRGHEIFLVSSGAVLCGVEKLGLARNPKNLPLKQAAAAVGQSRLMWAYERFFGKFQIKVAQVLLTHDDIVDRRRFINARNTLMTLLDYEVLSIINENDTVAVDEIKVGDNDALAAQVAHLVDASLLILLSDVDGLYSSDPVKFNEAQLITLVEEVTGEIEKMAGGAGPKGGTGGMASKIKAAKGVTTTGVTVLILNGTSPGIIGRAFCGEAVGTLFLPKRNRLSSKKQWIAHSLKVRGKVILDQGAAEALLKKGRSLLSSGIRVVEGKFDVGDAILCCNEEGVEIARGLTHYSASELTRIKGLHSSKIESVLGYKSADEVIHRDNMVIFHGTERSSATTGR